MNGRVFLLVLALWASVAAQAQAQAAGPIGSPAPSPPQTTVSQSATPPGTPTAPRAAPKVVVRETDTPLQLDGQTYHLAARVHRLAGSGQRALDETTEWWELRDPNGGVVYRRSYPVNLMEWGFDPGVDVRARVFTTEMSSGVLVEGGESPSAPGSGWWVQVFGFKWEPGPKAAAPLIAFGPPIAAEGEFLGMATDNLRGQASMELGRPIILPDDVLRFRIWTGNFSIIYQVLINWITGKLEPSWHCFRMTSKGQVERCAYPVQVEPQPRTERTFVRLFHEPEEGPLPKHVVVERTSTIEFLQAEVHVTWSENAGYISLDVAPDDDVWLKVRIDGREGWIHTQEDFDAIGLPAAG